MALPPDSPSGRLAEVAWVFLKLGTVAFGGPAAHIAMMEQELVRRRGWVSHETFLDLVAASNLIPGPNSTELAIHLGRERAGWRGLVVAGVCFIVPASVIVGVAAWAYVRWGSLPQAAGVLAGVKPVILAVLAQALWGLGRTGLKTPGLGVIAAAAFVLALGGVGELPILFGAGLGFAIGAWARGSQASPLPAIAATPTVWASVAGGGATAAAVGAWPLFGVFLKIGSVLFGSGYVLVAFLRGELVTKLGWLTEAQLLDAVAVGQVTPGPVFTTATFVGYVLAGVPGAVAATVGIFLPAFVFVAVSGPLVPWLRRSPVAGGFLDGVIAASLALMAAATVWLAKGALVTPWSVAVMAAAAALLIRWKVNATWLVAGGAVVGVAMQLLGY
jgi:chromate transporter